MQSVKFERVKNSARNGFFGLLFKLVAVLFPFAVRTVLIKTLGNEYLGLNSLFVAILQILSLSELGLSSALVYNLYKPVNDDDFEKIAKYMNFYKSAYRLIGLFIAVLGLICLPFLDFFIEGHVPDDVNLYVLFFIYLVNTCLSYFFFSYKSALLNAYQRNDLVSKAGVFSCLFLNIAQISALLLFANYYVFAVFLPISTLLNNFLVFYFSRELNKKLYPFRSLRLEREKIHALFKNIGALFGHKVGAVFICSIDNIFISSILGLVPLAIFNNYYYVITALNGFFDIFLTSLLPGIGNYLLNHTEKENYSFFKRVCYMQELIAISFTACMICLYHDFICLWVGVENTYESFGMVILFALYFYSWKFRSVGLMFKDAAGMWKNDFFKPYVGIIFNVVANVILVTLIGVAGALITTIAIFVMIYFPWETKVLFRDLFKINAREYVFLQFGYLILAIVVCFVTYFTVSQITVSGVIGLFLKLSVSGAISVLTLVAATFWTSDFKYLKQKICNLLKK